MSKGTPAGELSDGQIGTTWNAGLDNPHDQKIMLFARAIIAADRELRRGDVAMPLLPEPHFGDGRYLGIALNGDAFTAAQMREYAQAALAAKDAEIASLKANRDHWKAIALMYNTKYSEGTVEITALKAERDALKQDAERLDWLDQNIFSRENINFMGQLDPTMNMWVTFSPKGHQGSARNILDAAMQAQGVKS